MAGGAGTRVGGAAVERESAGARRVRDLAHRGTLVPEGLVVLARRFGFEGLGAFDEDALAARVALVVELAANGDRRVSFAPSVGEEK